MKMNAKTSAAQVLPTLIKVIAEETGYPGESITSDMNLEADLGVDSIKVVEILSKVSEEFGVNWEDLDDEKTSRLMELKKVSEVAEFIQGII